MYGIWNSYRKEWQFGICEPTEIRAYRALFKKIGRDAYKWRFEAKKLPNGKIPKVEPKLKLNLNVQYYKKIPLKLIDRNYKDYKAKQYFIIDTGQIIWIPNSYLKKDGTIQKWANLDFKFNTLRGGE